MLQISVSEQAGKLRENLVLRTLGVLATLFALWLLMSGLFEPKLIWLGLGSALVAVFVIKRMDSVDGDRLVIDLSALNFVGYLFWLMREIIRSNWAVSKIILSSDMPVCQRLFKVRNSQRTDLAQVIFANSITVTPGTITVETEGRHFFVHAVAFDDTVPEALADMDARVTACEPVGPN